MTGHRLRATLEDPALLVLEDGRLSLDASRCWVDLWELEQVERDPDAADDDRLLQLYRGAFLAGEDAAWCIPARERQERRFVQLALQVGVRLEDDGERRRFYERCLDVASSAAPRLREALVRCRA